MRDTTVIDNERTAKQQEIKEAENNHFVVKQEILSIQRKIIDLQAEKKDKEIFESKASHILRIKRIELKALENEFWNSKNI